MGAERARLTNFFKKFQKVFGSRSTQFLNTENIRFSKEIHITFSTVLDRQI